MVYIHGESFEWNSGNPYDGSVLAAYGKVIVVTLNFRLGILGFLKAGTEEYSKSNFGLIDQIAALLWVKANIAAFGGDPHTVTLMGHGTGAVCASLLMLSPMILQGNKSLFQRAILMGGSALSDWALAGNPRDVTYQVARALNCQIQDDFAACLRKKRLDEIMAASAMTPPYRTRFGPVVDSLVIPNDPKKSMTTYTDIFRRFELMYGVTEIESIHLLGPEALKLGMLEKDRDQELRRYLRSRCEMKPELCVTRTLAEYTDSEFTLDDEKYDGYTGHEPDRASLARDALLDILSDARTVAPLVQMARYHAFLNAQSYFYVFTHNTQSKEYIRDKSYNGEELPYVFGVPLGGSKFHFVDHYSEKERLFSEIIMTYFCNFAYMGNPNIPRKSEYKTLGPMDWIQFDVDWPEFDPRSEKYLQLGIPPYALSRYREREMRYWNEVFPDISQNYTYLREVDPFPRKPIRISSHPPVKRPPPWILLPPGSRNPNFVDKFENFNKSLSPKEVYGTVQLTGTTAPDNMMDNSIHYGTVITSNTDSGKGVTNIIVIVMGTLFLLSNLCLFLVLYLKRYKKRKLRNAELQKNNTVQVNPENERQSKLMASDCSLIRIVTKSSRSDDVYEAVRTSGSGSKMKLPRQMSSSTIDAHTKVRDWITNEIVNKYSPRFLRRPRHVTEIKVQEPQASSFETTPFNDNNSTLGRSPTRPVSPNENFKTNRPPLVKSSSIPVQKSSKKPEKVSVAIDATPSGRGNSVLQQQPIELTKSLDRPSFDVPLRRSFTLEDFTSMQEVDVKQEFRKSTTSINLKYPPQDTPTVIRIEHSHSKSDPVQDIYSHVGTGKKLRTFDPNADVNVTCRDEAVQSTPLTPEESLMTIKRRNFPKVLPDYPTREALAKKRRSMPVANHFVSIPEVPLSANPNSPTSKLFPLGRFRPAPPPRTTSTLGRKPSVRQQPVCQSAPMLAEEPPASPEPEVTCNNLYFGPLVPKLNKTELSSSENSKLNTQPIYERLNSAPSDEGKLTKPSGRTVITADPNQPIKKIEPRVVIKPTMTRSISDPRKNIPRVVASDNLPSESTPMKEEDKVKSPPKPGTQIPTLVKTPKELLSSSESSPSEESDTGTVVKRI